MHETSGNFDSCSSGNLNQLETRLVSESTGHITGDEGYDCMASEIYPQDSASNFVWDYNGNSHVM